MLMGVQRTPVESAAFSPSHTENPADYGLATPFASHSRHAAQGSKQDVPIPVVPPPPSPSVGGEPGSNKPFGYSTGLRLSRAFRQRLSGKTLMVPSMGAHPAVGSVGFSGRQQRLDNGVAALNGDYTPSDAEIAATFTGSGLNAIQREMLAGNGPR